MPDTIHLINVGTVRGIPASEVRTGMSIMFNYGIVNRVVGIKPTKGKAIVIQVLAGDGKTYDMRKQPGTLVAAFQT